jgi:hypothetical protein
MIYRPSTLYEPDDIGQSPLRIGLIGRFFIEDKQIRLEGMIGSEEGNPLRAKKKLTAACNMPATVSVSLNLKGT